MKFLGTDNIFEDKILLICFWSLRRNTRTYKFCTCTCVMRGKRVFDKVTSLHLAFMHENLLAYWKVCLGRVGMPEHLM